MEQIDVERIRLADGVIEGFHQGKIINLYPLDIPQRSPYEVNYLASQKPKYSPQLYAKKADTK
jgi:hypothetical protein